ncbi:hypothetical protein ESCO_005990 [Escovopsis weberi]|uniref:Uncharacterized protein n=1 Tax=Escovopsis weberi TaxID=150374 RepID=A0A0M8N015_ESCWE|nr:hypothetical protein ESCO_005990 [Escovopsis weberi]
MATADDAAAARSRQSSDSSLTTFYTSVEISDRDGGGEVTTATSTAIHLLNSMLGAGTSRRQPAQKPVPIPPPRHLALLATITVHPLHTTRAEKLEHLDVPGRALAYLRSVLAAVGPIQADFRTAFQFREPSRRRRAPAAQDSESDQMSVGSDVEAGLMRCRMANEASVWEQGKDFWDTVGWAFRCSTAMPHRWRYWRAWLEFMLDVLEADWAERERIDEEALAARGGGEKEKEAPTAARKESMMAMYMGQTHINSIVKALLVYGEAATAASYSEVFEKEHRGPRRPSLSVVGKRKRDRDRDRDRDRELDVANGQFGDYLDDEGLSSGISEPPTPRKPRAKRDGDVLGAGMAESVGLRLRLFRLVSAAVFTQERRHGELGLLYAGFAASVAALPVDVFAAVASQRPNALLLETHITLTKQLFDKLLPLAAVRSPQRVDPETHRIGGLSAAILEQCYACHAAVGAGEAEPNAKLSLLVESAVQLLWACGGLAGCADGLAQAVERGIAAREDKVGRRTGRGRGRAEPPEGNAMEVLRLSAERLRVLMGILRSED